MAEVLRPVPDLKRCFFCTVGQTVTSSEVRAESVLWEVWHWTSNPAILASLFGRSFNLYETVAFHMCDPVPGCDEDISWPILKRNLPLLNPAWPPTNYSIQERIWLALRNWLHSSVAEQCTGNAQGVGSIPAREPYNMYSCRMFLNCSQLGVRYVDNFCSL